MTKFNITKYAILDYAIIATCIPIGIIACAILLAIFLTTFLIILTFWLVMWIFGVELEFHRFGKTLFTIKWFKITRY